MMSLDAAAGVDPDVPADPVLLGLLVVDAAVEPAVEPVVELPVVELPVEPPAVEPAIIAAQSDGSIHSIVV
jgi:hypothetical protein